MRIALLITVLSLVCSTFQSCTPFRGCTENTADNFDVTAEEDDGTCIPSRDKLIGEFTYTNIWTDVISGGSFFSFGTIQITEANTGHNEFNTNFDGQLFLQGSITQSNLTFEYHTMDLSTYTGSGTWLRNDSVDMVLNITFNDPLLPIPQPYAFYCKKTP